MELGFGGANERSVVGGAGAPITACIASSNVTTGSKKTMMRTDDRLSLGDDGGEKGGLRATSTEAVVGAVEFIFGRKEACRTSRKFGILYVRNESSIQRVILRR